MKKQTAIILCALIVLLVSVSAVSARRATSEDTEQICIPKPASAFSLAMVTESVLYLIGGGMGPLLIVLLMVVIAIIITHLIWNGF